MTILFSKKNKIYNIEFTIHKCSNFMKRDIQLVFKNDININNENILIIPTWQKSSLSLLDINDDVTKEMDCLFLNFKNWILPIKKKVNEHNKWLDVSCPFTGKALCPFVHISLPVSGLTIASIFLPQIQQSCVLSDV